MDTKKKRHIVPLSIAVSSVLRTQYAMYFNNDIPDQYRYLIPMFFSVQGGGKTSTIEKVAEELNMGIFKLVICHIPLNELTGAEIPRKVISYEYFDPVNGDKEDGAREIKFQVENFEMQYIHPVWQEMLFKKAEELAKEGRMMYLFLDEFIASDPEAKKISLTLLLERQVRGVKIPDNVLMVAAGNYDDPAPDAAFYDRLFICCLDRALREDLPICHFSENEALSIIDSAYFNMYKNIDNTVREVKIQPINAVKVGFKDQLEGIRLLSKFLKDITEEITAKYNTTSPQALMCDDMSGGVVNMTCSKRKLVMMSYTLFTMVLNDELTPFNLSQLCLNLGFLGINEKLDPFYNRLMDLLNGKLEIKSKGVRNYDWDQYRQSEFFKDFRNSLVNADEVTALELFENLKIISERTFDGEISITIDKEDSDHLFWNIESIYQKCIVNDSEVKNLPKDDQLYKVYELILKTKDKFVEMYNELIKIKKQLIK